MVASQSVHIWKGLIFGLLNEMSMKHPSHAPLLPLFLGFLTSAVKNMIKYISIGSYQVSTDQSKYDIGFISLLTIFASSLVA
jgi:hypothetical protein